MEEGHQNVASQFRHDPLLVGQFRLVKILPGSIPLVGCHVEAHDFEIVRRPPYTCLSYVWGPPEPVLRRDIQLNGCAFRVRRNLLDFLSMARLKSTYLKKYFWIDALCIDQNNVAERNEQVSKMGQIYSDAEEVVAWMGPDLPFSFYRNPFGQFLEWLNPSYLRGLVSASSPTKIERQFLNRVRHNEYWTRAWIVQEQRLARKLTILIGSTQMRMKRLRRVHDMSSFEFFHGTWYDFTPMTAFMQGPARSLRHSLPLVELLSIHSEVRCAVRLDRVYSLLAMSEEGPHIQVDYRSSRTSLLVRILRLNNKRMCLCLPTYLISALGLAYDEAPEADMFTWGERLCLEIILPSTKIRKLSRPSLNKSCKCAADAGTQSQDLVLCMRAVCRTANNTHFVFPLNAQPAGEIKFSAYWGPQTLGFTHPPNLYSTLDTRKRVKLHMCLSLSNLVAMEKQMHASLRRSCKRTTASVQYKLHGLG